MKKVKHNSKSEAAQRAAIGLLRKLTWDIFVGPNTVKVEAVRLVKNEYGNLIGASTVAEFDLRDCYRKRAPLTGITKALRAAVQPKRGKKRNARNKKSTNRAK